MIYVFNIGVIAIVLLIAYWWGNQGLFSAILHLLCVIAAGAIALALWEPIVVGLLLRGNGFDDYAWGITLIVLFLISLLILRIISDKSVPANVAIPNWANLVFGIPVGAFAGILTMGIFLIGAGYIQSSKAMMDYAGYGRSGRNGIVTKYDDNSMWFPVHKITNDFYGYLSVGSLRTRQPLLHYNPELHAMASLVRDSFGDGKGKLSLRPADARVEYLHSGGGKLGVKVHFEGTAIDFGEQLTLSRSQIRLIGKGSGNKPVAVAYPTEWVIGNTGMYRFDDISHYITSTAGAQSVDVVILFATADLKGTKPEFIQIRGTRFRLPTQQEVPSIIGAAADIPSASPSATVDTSAQSISEQVEVSNSISPVIASTNMVPPGLSETDRFLSEGDGEFPRQMSIRPSRNLMLRGIYEPEGAKCIQVSIARGAPTDLFSGIQERAGANAELVLVDENGQTYYPTGFIHEKADVVRIRLAPGTYIKTVEQLPILPTAGDQKLRLVFLVPQGLTVKALKLGTVTIGTCNLKVEGGRARIEG